MPKAKLAKINFILLFCLLSLAWVQSFTPLQTVLATEENIDSFDVHPGSGRWETTAAGVTASIDSGQLVLNDTGDGSLDSYTLLRDLRTLDGKIEFRYYLSANETNIDNERMDFKLCNPVGNYYLNFVVKNIKSGSVATSTFIEYRDEDNTYRSYTISDALYSSIWYRIVIDYDILKSTYRIRAYFDNNTKVFDVDNTDLTYRPYFFSIDNPVIALIGYSKYSTKFVEYKIDYVKAPFKERDWVQHDTPTDAFIYDRWDGCRETNDSDTSGWQIVVPYLDSYTGTITANSTDNSLFSNADTIALEVELWGVDADDGGTHRIVGCSCGFISPYPAYSEQIYGDIYDGNLVATAEKHHAIATVGTDVNPAMDFSLELTNDRSSGSLQVRYYPDVESTSFYDWAIGFEVADYVTDPSQEFIIQVNHNLNDINSTFEGYTTVESFSIVERGEFSGRGIPLVPREDSGGGGIFGWIGEIFIAIGRLIIAGFAMVGLDIVAAIGNIQTWLNTISTAITGAIGNIQGWLNTVSSAITSAIGDIQTWLGTVQTAITDAIGNIQSWINGVWAAFSAAAGTFIDACITALGTLISDFVGWCIDCVFWLWDQLSLPDLLAIIDVLLTGFVQLVTNIPATIIQFVSALQAIWMLVIYLGVIFFFLIPCLSAPSVGEWIEKVIQAMGFDITLGLQVLGTGMRIPAVLPWMVCIIYYVLTDVIFGGFF